MLVRVQFLVILFILFGYVIVGGSVFDIVMLNEYFVVVLVLLVIVYDCCVVFIGKSVLGVSLEVL